MEVSVCMNVSGCTVCTVTVQMTVQYTAYLDTASGNIKYKLVRELQIGLC